MGDSINMAARLMCHPEAEQNLLCDEKTYNLCRNAFEIKPLGETIVKGKANPISIFRPLSATKEISDNKQDDESKKIEQNATFIGREKERTAIKNLFGKMVNKEESGILILEAEGGQGLSTLYDYSLTEAKIRGCHIV
jgi:hypothetical protein